MFIDVLKIFGMMRSPVRCIPTDNPTNKQLKELIMATKQEVLDAIAAEKQEVITAVNDLNTQIQALKDQIASGSPVTAADLDEITAAVHDIFVPPVV